jgi:hypothetical protein
MPFDDSGTCSWKTQYGEVPAQVEAAVAQLIERNAHPAQAYDFRPDEAEEADV